MVSVSLKSVLISVLISKIFILISTSSLVLASPQSSAVLSSASSSDETPKSETPNNETPSLASIPSRNQLASEILASEALASERLASVHPSVIGTLPLANSPMVILSQSYSGAGARPPVGNHWNVFATAIESFNLKMLQMMESERPNENIIFSPLSLALTLSKIASGSMNSSRLQILETLGVRSSFSSFRWMNRDIFRVSNYLVIVIINLVLLI